MVLALLGCFILAFGWFGFNPGSTLGAAGNGSLRIGIIAVNTMLAGAWGSVAAMVYTWVSGARKPDIGMMGNGLLAGLVAITAPSGYVSPLFASIIGVIAGVNVVFFAAYRGGSIHVIPICTLRGHSKMGKIGHKVKKRRIVLKSSQLVTKSINNGIKGDKETVRKSFFPYFLPHMLNRIEFRARGRLSNQTNVFGNNQIFGAVPPCLIDLYHQKIRGKSVTDML